MRFANHLALTVIALILLLAMAACQLPPRDTSSVERPARQVSAPFHDLEAAEADGGHTLSRHVGKKDAELHERLQSEPDISAASTYTDRDTAERVVGITIQQAHSKIERWLDRRSHPNLVLNYRGDRAHPIGRTLHRGNSAAQPCSDAIVVLHWDGARQYHVLTSYPECR